MTMKKCIIVSWRGSQPVFAKCSTAIQHSFAEVTVPWRKRGTQFPAHVTLPVSFVPYAVTLIVNEQSQMSNKQKLSCAVAHLYFTECCDVDEYRSTTRSDLVEWFASMRDCGCTDWLIVVDTCRARENKTRAALMEKLKADFSKQTNKIIEVDTSGSKWPALLRSVRDLLVQALDALVVAYEDQLQTEKENCYLPDWNYLDYMDAQMALSQLYHGLGLEEQVLAQYDELEALLSVLITNSVEPRAQWLKSLSANRPTRCPSVSHLGKNVSLLSELSLLELRCILLAKQVLSLLDQYKLKCQSAPAVQYQAQFCSLLLKYSYNCLLTFTEERNMLQMDFGAESLACWKTLFCLETFQLCSGLCDPVQVDSASHFTCHLWLELCTSVLELGRVCALVPGQQRSPEQIKMASDLCAWLPSNSPLDGEDATPVAKLRNMLTSQESFGHLFQKFYENAMAVMKHFDWKRQSRWLGKQLADFLVLADRTAGALPYYSKLLSGLRKEGWLEAYIWLLEELIEYFESMSDLYHSALVEFYCHLCMAARRKTQRCKYGIKLTALLSNKSRPPVRISPRSRSFSPLQVLSLSVSPSSAIMHQSVTCRVRVINSLCVPLPSLTAKLSWRRLNEGEQHGSGSPLRFDLNVKGDLARVSCNAGVHRILAPQPSDPSPSPDSRAVLVFTHHLALEPGENELSICGEVDEVGYFVPVSLDLSIDWFTSSLSLDIFGLPRSGLLLRVKTEQPSVHLVPLNEPLFGGVEQQLSFDLCPGTERLPQTTVLSLSAVEGSAIVQFETGSHWSSQRCIDLPSLSPLEHFSSVVRLCCWLECLRDESPVKAKIRVEWLERTWTVELYFRPVLLLREKFIVLEHNVLLELSVNRCAGAMDLIPTRATLAKSDDSEGDDSAPQPVLLHNELQPLLATSIQRILWRVPEMKRSEPDEYVLELWYKVAQDEEQQFCYRDRLLLTDEWAEYELCCQISSSALLCRAESICDMIISLRSLRPNRRTENVLACIDADPKLWFVEDSQKMVAVKESGLGQVAFSVVPRLTGYLPYPGVQLRRWAGISETDLYPVRCFVRTKGKQVHVLGPLHRPTAEPKRTKERPVSMDF